MMWSRKSGSQRTWRPFFSFSGDHLNLDRKTVSVSAKTFFSFFLGGDNLNLAGKNTSILVKTNQNLGQDRLILCLASKRSPQSKLLTTLLLQPK